MPPASSAAGFQRVEAETISLAELSRRLAEETRGQVRELRWAVEQAVLTVLINDPPQNRRLWQRLQKALHEPLARLGMLRDLWGARLGELSAGAMIWTHIWMSWAASPAMWSC